MKYVLGKVDVVDDLVQSTLALCGTPHQESSVPLQLRNELMTLRSHISVLSEIMNDQLFGAVVGKVTTPYVLKTSHMSGRMFQSLETISRLGGSRSGVLSGLDIIKSQILRAKPIVEKNFDFGHLLSKDRAGKDSYRNRMIATMQAIITDGIACLFITDGRSFVVTHQYDDNYYNQGTVAAYLTEAMLNEWTGLHKMLAAGLFGDLSPAEMYSRITLMQVTGTSDGPLEEDEEEEEEDDDEDNMSPVRPPQLAVVTEDSTVRQHVNEIDTRLNGAPEKTTSVPESIEDLIKTAIGPELEDNEKQEAT